MSARGTLLVRLAAGSLLCLAAADALGGDPGATLQWRSVGEQSSSETAARSVAPAAGLLPAVAPREAVGSLPVDSPPVNDSVATTLPREQGQVWREYDLSDYTLRVTSTERPEQAVVDWILRETGYEAWHGQPLAILSASPRTLRVYHTPQMQEVVAGIVERFVDSEAKSRAFGLRVVTLDHPNWRAKAQGLLQPVVVQTPGAQAWVLQKEDAAVLLAQLRRRSDYREHSSPHLLVSNGQPAVVSTTQPRTYFREVSRRSDAWPGYREETGQIDEGFSLEFCPLLSLDRKTLDATVKCTVCQIEKMVPVILDVPTAAAPRQKARVEVPQIGHFQFHERFRWPADEVLLISMGIVAMPGPAEGKPLVPGIPLPLGTSPNRADLLVFIEAKEAILDAPSTPAKAEQKAQTYHGRY